MKFLSIIISRLIEGLTLPKVIKRLVFYSFCSLVELFYFHVISISLVLIIFYPIIFIISIIRKWNMFYTLLILVWPLMTISLSFPIERALETCYREVIVRLHEYKKNNEAYPNSLKEIERNLVSCKNISNNEIKVFGTFTIRYLERYNSSYSLSYELMSNLVYGHQALFLAD